MLRRMLLAASASDRMRRMIVSAPYTRDVVARYVAGEDAARRGGGHPAAAGERPGGHP